MTGGYNYLLVALIFCSLRVQGQPAGFVANTECVFPFPYRGQMYDECTVIGGQLMCANEQSELLECHGSALPPPTPVPTVTVVPDASPAQTPTSTTQSAPTAESTTSSSTTQSNDQIVPDPTCILPFAYRGVMHDECINIGGKFMCPNEQNELLECSQPSSAPTPASVLTVVPDPSPAPASAASPSPTPTIPVQESPTPSPAIQSSSQAVPDPTCILPFAYRGVMHDECINIGGRFMCANEQNELLECSQPSSTPVPAPAVPSPSSAPAPATAPTPTPITQAEPVQESPTPSPAIQSSSQAVPDPTCFLPFPYRGVMYNECVNIGGKFMCANEQNELLECSLPSPASTPTPDPTPTPASAQKQTIVAVRNTTTGDNCIIPFVFKEEAQNDCVIDNGEEICLVKDGTFQTCAPIGSVAGTSSVQEGTEIVEEVTLSKRTTINGEECSFPLVYRGQVLKDCTTIGGKEQCQTESNSAWQECAPLTANTDQPKASPQATIDGYNCSFPFLYRGLVFNECTEIANKLQCKIAEDSNWHQCLTGAEATEILTQTNNRMTVDGFKCSFPTIYRGNILDDCAEIAGAMQCKIEEDSDWHECQRQVPENVTEVMSINGNMCSFPFIYRQISYTQCVEIGGKFLCEAESGNLEECVQDENSTSSILNIQTNAKFTVDGLQCSFPFTFRGDVVTECIEISNKMQCQVVEDGDWHECQKEVLEEALNRTTVEGYQCQFPTEFEGQILNDCTPIDGVPSCRVLEDSDWHQCDIVGVFDQMSAGTRKVTVDGDECMFPTVYRGNVLYECIDLGGAMQCKTAADDGWHECAPEVLTGIDRTTTDGLQCKFPSIYRGTVLDDCTEIANQLRCKVEEDSNWHVCADYSQPISTSAPDMINRTTVDGLQCVFPAIFRGQVLNDCAEIAGKMQCEVREDGDWHECAPEVSDTLISRSTVDGFDCSFPFSYRGIVYTNCVEIANKMQCKIEEDNVFHECEAMEGAVQVDDSGSQQTVDGFNCVFPTIYRGTVMNECIDIAGKKQCKIAEDDDWHICQNATSSIAETFLASDGASRETVDGFQCFFPAIHQGLVLNDCAEIAGKMQCKIKEDDDWHECKSQISENATATIVTTINNETCQFPFIYRGIVYNQCIEVGQKFVCQTSGGLQECAEQDNQIDPQMMQTDAKFTTDGLQCDFPFLYRGAVFRECIDLAGKLQCRVKEDENYHECAPEVLDSALNRTTVDGFQCDFPFVYRGQVLNDCTVIAGIPQCKIVEDSDWHECSVSQDGMLSQVSAGTRKVTVDGVDCDFPFIYRDTVLNECIEIAGTMMCQTAARDGWKECAAEVQVTTERTTTDGFNCTFPFIYRSVVFDDCTEIGGNISCKIAEDDDWHTCADYPTAMVADGAMPSSTTQTVNRTTVDGLQCVFPSIYQGQVLNDCAEVAGKMQCKAPVVVWHDNDNEYNDWQECATEVDTDFVARLTADGFNCSFPFIYRGLAYTTCIEIADINQCKISEDDNFHECLPLAGELQTQKSLTRITTDGLNCVFPTIYRGMVIDDCIEIANAMQCKVVEDDDWHECAATNTTNVLEADAQSIRGTVDGLTCAFPIVYRQMVYNDCVDIAGKLQCKTVEDGNWHECEATQADTLMYANRTTVDGDKCVFPIYYNDEIATDCVQDSGKFMCQIVDGGMQECDMDQGGNLIAITTALRQTVDGRDCEFPFVYDQDLYTDCTTISGIEQCMIGGSLVECVALGGATSPSTQPVPANRTTIGGEQCVFPFQYNNKTYYNCAIVDGIEQCQSEDDDLDQCSKEGEQFIAITYPERFTVDNYQCAFPFVWRSQLFSECTVIAGEEQCKVNEDNDWHICLPAGTSPPQTGLLQPSIASTPNPTLMPPPPPPPSPSPNVCSFPFSFISGGDTYNECVDFGGESICANFEGTIIRCPQSPTACVFPFSLYPGGTNYTECIEIGGDRICSNFEGTLISCSEPGSPPPLYLSPPPPSMSPPPPPSPIAPPPSPTSSVIEAAPIQESLTLNPECVFPFVYRSVSYDDCLNISGLYFKCKNSQDQLIDCYTNGASLNNTSPSPNPTPTPTPALTPTPSPAPVPSPTVPQSPPPPPAVEIIFPDRYTIENYKCKFPLEQFGELFGDCIINEGNFSCKVEEDTDWHICLPRGQGGEDFVAPQSPSPTLLFPERYTVDNDKCVFPWTYRGEDYGDCVPVNSLEMCQASKSGTSLKECLPRGQGGDSFIPPNSSSPSPSPSSTPSPSPSCSPPSSPLPNNSSSTTSLPAPQLEVKNASDGATFKFKYSNSSFSGDEYYTRTGRLCKFPFEYNGATYYLRDGCAASKTDASISVCLTENNLIEVCAQQYIKGELQQLGSTSPEEKSSGRSTAAVIAVSILVILGIILVVASVIYTRYHKYKFKLSSFAELHEGGGQTGLNATLEEPQASMAASQSRLSQLHVQHIPMPETGDTASIAAQVFAHDNDSEQAEQAIKQLWGDFKSPV